MEHTGLERLDEKSADPAVLQLVQRPGSRLSQQQNHMAFEPHFLNRTDELGTGHLRYSLISHDGVEIA